MADGYRDASKELDSECLFSPTCGRNICIDGCTATWTNNDSGGRFFIDKYISSDEEIILTFSGKGHAEVGIISIDPITITNFSHVGNIKELTVIQTTRIYKQTGTTKIKRSKEGDRIITEAEDRKSRSKVDKKQTIWVTVNILFGDLKVKIGCKGYKFLPNKGENVSTKDECANLKYPYPCAVCFVMNPIKHGDILSFQADDINKVGAPSKNCSLKLAISKSNPAEFMLSADEYCDITSLPVTHFDEIPAKSKNEIRFELTTAGTVKISYEKGTITKEAGIEQLYCVFELGRIQLRCARKERHKHEDSVLPKSKGTEQQTSINQSDVPDSIYMNSKRELDEIKHDAEEISIYSDDYNPVFESRNIEGATTSTENEPTTKYTSESKFTTTETGPDNYSLHDEISTRLDLIEEHLNRLNIGKESTMQSSEMQILRSEIKEIKTLLTKHSSNVDGDSNISNHLNVTSQTEHLKPLHETIQEHFSDLVSLIEISLLLDCLYQAGNITIDDIQRLRQLSKSDMAEANRELLFIISRRQNLDTEIFEEILFKSKQDGVLAILFPHEYNKKPAPFKSVDRQKVMSMQAQSPVQRKQMQYETWERREQSHSDRFRGCVNSFSKLTEAFPVRNETAEEISKILHRQIFSRFGSCHIIVTDREQGFASNLVAGINQIYHVEHFFTRSYHPKTNYVAERTNKTIIHWMRTLVDENHLNWSKLVLVPDIPLEVDFSGNQISDFSKLVFTSYHVDRNKLSSTFWVNIFWPVIENKDSNLCLFLLTIMTDMTTDQWKECHHYLLEGLSSSLINQDKDTTKVIAWFITKKFFLSLDASIRENITDIWPAFKCNYHRKQQIFCSDKIAINIEMNILRPDLPDTFWKIDIHYIIDERVQNEESSQIHKHLQNSSGKIHFPNKKSISGVDAKHLFIEHSNLSLVCKSSFKSTGFLKKNHKVIEQSCFQLYCKRKGFIPIGENHFPSTFNGLQTDVLDGRPHFLSQLKIGNQVGTDEYKRGTLGGFVQVRGDKAFLTCLHVFLSADELASDNLSLDDEKTVSVKLYSKNKNPLICGKIRDIAFEVDNEKETSIDAALVEIQTDSIENSDYVDIVGRQLSFRAIGAISGFQESTTTQVHENKDKNIDLESIEDTYSKAVLDEIKTNVKIVIQSLQLIPFAVSPDEHAIKMRIEQNCDPNISTEIKAIVIDVIKSIYPTIQCAGGVDIDSFIHEIIFCNTQSRFSAIIGDVHMQQAFLKKTGQNMAVKRTSRRVYNQLYISNIPFQPGDSGTCIYVLSPVCGCIGMAIADHPQGGCIATPIMDILKHFKIRIK
ncbi:unnamed protein product [Mytilus coruscus]|uniref:Integrase catalytic domain-containing protein n=1 Tax=Mytilus coruscus TaxID=42192 RepID=A0A6J8B6X7_MYTCO|nr:unnamed protein product [Mytilus coruscus]